MKILVILLCIAAIACTYPSAQEKVEAMVVPKRAKPVIVAPPNEPPPPAFQPYYLPYNFIIDSTGNLFFYQHQLKRYCGSIDWDTPPEFINLQPSNMVQVPSDAIVQFVELNIFNVEKDDRLISIASLCDTIKSEGVSKMVKLFKDSTNRCRWYFRHATQEEKIVLGFKKNNNYYAADRIDWDSSQTLFPFPVDEKMQIRFAPPQVEKN